MSFVSKTTTVQVADHLRRDLFQGRWKFLLPGRDQLASELGVNHKTIEAALRQLEKEGVVVNPSKGSRRRISTFLVQKPVSLRIAVLLSEMADRNVDYIVDIRHRLRLAGHAPFEVEKSMVDLAMNPRRIAGLASRTPADAWIIVAGSRDVLEVFSQSPAPAFALFGPMREIAIAGAAPHKTPALIEATRTLLDQGHRRLALLVRPRRRLPAPGLPEQAYSEELKSRGIKPSRYHLPDWDETPESFHAMLQAMFRVTPPTALIVDEAALFVAVMQFCITRRIRVPEDLSLVCTDDDIVFSWCHRSIAHIAWDRHPVVRRLLQWADNVSRGKTDLRQTFNPARFAPGGTIGPPRLRQ